MNCEMFCNKGIETDLASMLNFHVIKPQSMSSEDSEVERGRLLVDLIINVIGLDVVYIYLI